MRPGWAGAHDQGSVPRSRGGAELARSLQVGRVAQHDHDRRLALKPVGTPTGLFDRFVHGSEVVVLQVGIVKGVGQEPELLVGDVYFPFAECTVQS